MKFQEKPTRESSASDPSGAPTETEADHRPASSYDARRKRVADYQVDSLAKDDSLEANLGSVNSGLMGIALCLEQDILQPRQTGSPDVERLSDKMPAIECLLRVTRQVDRFAQLELRTVEARQQKPAKGNRAAHGVDSMAEDPLATIRNGQSEDFEV